MRVSPTSSLILSHILFIFVLFSVFRSRSHEIQPTDIPGLHPSHGSVKLPLHRRYTYVSRK